MLEKLQLFAGGESFESFYMPPLFSGDLAEMATVEETLENFRRKLHEALELVPDMVFCYHDRYKGSGSFLYISPSVKTLYGLKPEQLAKTGALLLPALPPTEQESFLFAFREARNSMSMLCKEYQAITFDRSIQNHFCEAQPVKQVDGTIHWFGAVYNLSKKRKQNQSNWRHANFDILTALPNRQLFCKYFSQAAHKARISGHSLSVIVVNLDHFQDINDSLGYDGGDALLAIASERLKKCVRAADIVGRLCADEFIAVLQNSDGRRNITRTVKRILQALSEPYHFNSQTVRITASVGLTQYPQDNSDNEFLLRNATLAMRAAKRNGRNRYVEFSHSMNVDAERRVSLVNELRASVSTLPLKLCFHPIVDTKTNKICMAEALLRWEHPEKGMIFPGEFIALAEEIGVIDAIGEWVFQKASEQAARWHSAGHSNLQVSINVSPFQFRHTHLLPERWSAYLKNLRLPADAVILEITEGLLLDSDNEISRQIKTLQNNGFKIALDDFGTGFSALSHLRKYKIDFIKIDRSFVKNLPSNSIDLALCEAITSMARELGIKVIAEGIETEAQKDVLKIAGCDYAQGFLFALPMTASEFGTFLHSQKN